MNSLIDFLDSHNVKRGMVWLDIETNTSPGCGWGVAEDLTTGYKNETLGASNCAFVGELISALRARGEVVGTYVSCSFGARHRRCACRPAKLCHRFRLRDQPSIEPNVFSLTRQSPATLVRSLVPIAVSACRPPPTCGTPSWAAPALSPPPPRSGAFLVYRRHHMRAPRHCDGCVTALRLR
jgi:hypothetical protein